MKTIYFYRLFPLFYSGFRSLHSTRSIHSFWCVWVWKLITIKMEPYNYYRIIDIFLVYLSICLISIDINWIVYALPLSYTFRLKVHTAHTQCFREWNAFYLFSYKQQTIYSRRIERGGMKTRRKGLSSIIFCYFGYVSPVLRDIGHDGHLIWLTSNDAVVYLGSKYGDNDE